MTKLSTIAALILATPFSALVGCSAPDSSLAAPDDGTSTDVGTAPDTLSIEAEDGLLFAAAMAEVAAAFSRPATPAFHRCAGVYECRFPDGRAASLRFVSSGPDCTLDGYDRFVPYGSIRSAVGAGASLEGDFEVSTPDITDDPTVLSRFAYCRLVAE